ncbi:MAG: hypothetical protein WA970_25890 [Gammaproteobacteria bacterium]
MLAHLGLKAEDLPELERDFLGPLDRDREYSPGLRPVGETHGPL